MIPGLPPYEWWKNPPDKVLLRVYVFNITNAAEFQNGTDSKIKLQEVGPYEDSKSVAMMKHGLKLMKSKTEYLNAGQLPVITMEQPFYALAKGSGETLGLLTDIISLRREKLSHTNVTFSENSTMTYVARRTAIFQPELNHLSLNDTLVLPNIGVLFVEDKRVAFPAVSAALQTAIYMDDVVTSVKFLATAKRLQQELIVMLVRLPIN
uniref:Uncharacterized protein n=1 Tax=Timema genevievae TaxID=629358 RepID=A0A7R9K8M5_TIMGE|nr:unnamed protein product [Timema genevievae]